jgi:hypothetical protein
MTSQPVENCADPVDDAVHVRGLDVTGEKVEILGPGAVLIVLLSFVKRSEQDKCRGT